MPRVHAAYSSLIGSAAKARLRVDLEPVIPASQLPRGVLKSSCPAVTWSWSTVTSLEAVVPGGNA